MLVFRVLATIFMVLSCVTCFLKNISIFSDWEHSTRDVLSFTFYGLLWRSFVIVALWIV